MIHWSHIQLRDKLLILRERYVNKLIFIYLSLLKSFVFQSTAGQIFF